MASAIWHSSIRAFELPSDLPYQFSMFVYMGLIIANTRNQLCFDLNSLLMKNPSKWSGFSSLAIDFWFFFLRCRWRVCDFTCCVHNIKWFSWWVGEGPNVIISYTQYGYNWKQAKQKQRPKQQHTIFPSNSIESTFDFDLIIIEE